MAKYDRIYRTRHQGLGFTRVVPGCWMYIDLTEPEEPAQVGAQYPSKDELLADADRYFAQWGLELPATVAG